VMFVYMAFPDNFFISIFYSAAVWTQGLHLEPLQPALLLWWCFRDRVSWSICLHWLWISILLISASWVARITDVSHQHLASDIFF
jgi:hypothetical protein